MEQLRTEFIGLCSLLMCPGLRLYMFRITSDRSRGANADAPQRPVLLPHRSIYKTDAKGAGGTLMSRAMQAGVSVSVDGRRVTAPLGMVDAEGRMDLSHWVRQSKTD